MSTCSARTCCSSPSTFKKTTGVSLWLAFVKEYLCMMCLPAYQRMVDCERGCRSLFAYCAHVPPQYLCTSVHTFCQQHDARVFSTPISLRARMLQLVFASSSICYHVVLLKSLCYALVGSREHAIARTFIHFRTYAHTRYHSAITTRLTLMAHHKSKLCDAF